MTKDSATGFFSDSYSLAYSMVQCSKFESFLCDSRFTTLVVAMRLHGKNELGGGGGGVIFKNKL
jgi:hypothetical protein